MRLVDNDELVSDRIRLIEHRLTQLENDFDKRNRELIAALSVAAVVLFCSACVVFRYLVGAM